MGQEPVPGSDMETSPSQAPLETTEAPPTATPSQANNAAAPADYKKAEGEPRRHQKMLLIVCFKLLCLVSHNLKVSNPNETSPLP